MNHKPTCHFSGALSDLASSVQKSHEKDPTNFYFLTISPPLQKLDPLCLWFLGNGRSGRWSLTELGVGGKLASKSTRARALQRAPQPPHLGYNGYKAYLGRAPHVWSSQIPKTGLRGLQDLSSDAQLTCLISYTRHHGYSPFILMGKQT